MSYLQHKDRSMEAKKSLREQTEYLHELQTKKRGGRPQSASKPDEMERILAYSIQKAKEKMQTIDTSIQQKANGELNGSRCEEHFISVNTVDSREVSLNNPIRNSSQITEVRRPSGSGGNDQNSTAIASAMKCLQDKIGELERKLEACNLDKQKLNQEARKTANMKESSELELQSCKRINQQLTDQKVGLEREIESLKKVIEDREKTIERMMRDMSKTSNSKEQALELQKEIQRLRNHCKQKDGDIEGQKQELQEYEGKLRMKQKEIERKGANILELQQQLSAKNKQITKLSELLRKKSQTDQFQNREHEVAKQLEKKLDELHRTEELNKLLIGKLESELEEERQRRSSQWMSRQTEYAYIEKINTLEGELSRVKSTTKAVNQQKLQKVVQDYERLREQYDNVLLRYERSEATLAAEEKEGKAYRRKFEDSRALLKDFVAGIHKLPTGVTSHLKFLLTRFTKIDSDAASRLDRSTSRSADKLSRSNRLRSASKDSKSGRKRKVLKMEDLNSSRNSAQSIGGSRSKALPDYRHEKSTLRSDTKSVHSRKSSPKEPPLSNSKVRHSLKDQPKQLIITDREIGLSSEINEIECKILQLKKQIKRLTGRQASTREEEEDIRCRRNELLEELQIKLEQLPALKQKLRKEGYSQV